MLCCRTAMCSYQLQDYHAFVVQTSFPHGDRGRAPFTRTFNNLFFNARTIISGTVHVQKHSFHERGCQIIVVLEHSSPKRVCCDIHGPKRELQHSSLRPFGPTLSALLSHLGRCFLRNGTLFVEVASGRRF